MMPSMAFLVVCVSSEVPRQRLAGKRIRHAPQKNVSNSSQPPIQCHLSVRERVLLMLKSRIAGAALRRMPLEGISVSYG